MTAEVHAQIAVPGGSKVYRVPFETVAAARRYVRGYQSPERAVIVTDRFVECYQGRTLIDREMREDDPACASDVHIYGAGSV